MEKFKTIALVVLSLALVIVSCLLVHQILITTNEPVAPIVKTDSVVRTETIYVKVPVEKVKYKEITKVESVFVEVPQTKKWWEDRFVFTMGVYGGYSPIYNNFDVVVGFGVGIRLVR